jgi:hypothetical protein
MCSDMPVTQEKQLPKVGYISEISEEDTDIGRDYDGVGMVTNKDDFEDVEDMVNNIEDVEWKEIGENGWLGNPFVMDDDKPEQEERKRVVSAFLKLFMARIHELNDTEFAKAVLELDGKLGCWCQSVHETGEDADLCHGEVIVSYIKKIRAQRSN